MQLYQLSLPSTRGSVRLEESPLWAYYHCLVDCGMKKGGALVAVMRKMLVVAVCLIKWEMLEGVAPRQARGPFGLFSAYCIFHPLLTRHEPDKFSAFFVSFSGQISLKPGDKLTGLAWTATKRFLPVGF